MVLGETVGPYTIGLAFVLLAGFPIAAKYIKNAVTVQGFGMRAELGVVKEDIKIAAEAAKVAASSVGDVNGEGSLQRQVSSIADWMEEESAKRLEGQHRQIQMAEAVADTQIMVISMREMLDQHSIWQKMHSDDDLRLFKDLQDSCSSLQSLLGEPIPGMTDEPLIPYVHNLKHALKNNEAAQRMLIDIQHTTLVDAIEVIKEAKTKLGIDEDTDGET